MSAVRPNTLHFDLVGKPRHQNVHRLFGVRDRVEVDAALEHQAVVTAETLDDRVLRALIEDVGLGHFAHAAKRGACAPPIHALDAVASGLIVNLFGRLPQARLKLALPLDARISAADVGGIEVPRLGAADVTVHYLKGTANTNLIGLLFLGITSGVKSINQDGLG